VCILGGVFVMWVLMYASCGPIEVIGMCGYDCGMLLDDGYYGCKLPTYLSGFWGNLKE